MPQEYFFNGHLRWTFFWANPNCWAAFLACSIAWAWCGQLVCREKTGRVIFKIATVALHAIELALWFLLVKTYSRGGLVAAVSAMAVFFLLHGKTRMKWPRCIQNMAARLVVVLAMCVIFGFAARMAPSHLAQDRSVLNRVELWKGALVMISDSPFQGWGHQLGGMAYINWYQPLTDATRPVGFVNSYLEVAVDHGAPVLFLTLLCAGALLYIIVRLRTMCWVSAAGASVVAWLVSNLWSSLWYRLTLWILPVLAVLCIIIAAFRLGKEIPRILAYASVFGIVIMTGIIASGHMLAKKTIYQARPVANGDAAIVWMRHSSEAMARPRTELWIDGNVMGRYWGRTIRSVSDSINGSLLVHAPWALRENRMRTDAGKCVYMGFQAELAWEMAGGEKTTMILHPAIYPPKGDFKGGRHNAVIVCLPEVDVSAYNLPWRRWAGKTGARLVFSPQSGTRINPGHEAAFWRSLLFDE
jgi:O-antigen ligase